MYTCQVIEIRHELFRQYSYYDVITYVNMRIILDTMPPRPRGFVNRLYNYSCPENYFMQEGLVQTVASVFFIYHVHADKMQWYGTPICISYS